MSAARDHRVEAWFHSLRDAVGARNEPLYHSLVVQFIITPEGAAFVQRNIATPEAGQLMSTVYQRLAPVLGLDGPEDLLTRMRDIPPTQVGDNEAAVDPGCLASTFMRYLRLGRDWTLACRLHPSYGVALAVFLFEPLLVFFEAAQDDPPQRVPSAPAGAGRGLRFA